MVDKNLYDKLFSLYIKFDSGSIKETVNGVISAGILESADRTGECSPQTFKANKRVSSSVSRTVICDGQRMPAVRVNKTMKIPNLSAKALKY